MRPRRLVLLIVGMALVGCGATKPSADSNHHHGCPSYASLACEPETENVASQIESKFHVRSVSCVTISKKELECVSESAHVAYEVRGHSGDWIATAK